MQILNNKLKHCDCTAITLYIAKNIKNVKMLHNRHDKRVLVLPIGQDLTSLIVVRLAIKAVAKSVAPKEIEQRGRPGARCDFGGVDCVRGDCGNLYSPITKP